MFFSAPSFKACTKCLIDPNEFILKGIKWTNLHHSQLNPAWVHSLNAEKCWHMLQTSGKVTWYCEFVEYFSMFSPRRLHDIHRTDGGGVQQKDNSEKLDG